jgi:hypothetical protein
MTEFQIYHSVQKPSIRVYKQREEKHVPNKDRPTGKGTVVPVLNALKAYGGVDV